MIIFSLASRYVLIQPVLRVNTENVTSDLSKTHIEATPMFPTTIKGEPLKQLDMSKVSLNFKLY